MIRDNMDALLDSHRDEVGRMIEGDAMRAVRDAAATEAGLAIAASNAMEKGKEEADLLLRDYMAKVDADARDMGLSAIEDYVDTHRPVEAPEAVPEVTVAEPQVAPEVTAPEVTEPEIAADIPERVVAPEVERQANRPLIEQEMTPEEIRRAVDQSASPATLKALRNKVGTLETQQQVNALKTVLVERLKMSKAAAGRIALGLPPVDEVTPEDLDALREFDDGMKDTIGDEAYSCTADDAACWHRSMGNRAFEIGAAGTVAGSTAAGAVGGAAIGAGAALLASGPVGWVAAAATGAAAGAKWMFTKSSATVAVSAAYMNEFHAASGEVGGFFNVNEALTRAALEPDIIFDAALKFYRADDTFERLSVAFNAMHDLPGLADIAVGDDAGFIEQFGDAEKWAALLDSGGKDA